MSSKKKKKEKKAATPTSKDKPAMLPDYYLAVFTHIHEAFAELLDTKSVTEPTEVRRSLVRAVADQFKDEATEAQYAVLYDLLTQIEKKLQAVIVRRPAFYWLHIYRRIAPGLMPALGGRTDELVTLEVRSFAEQAIFKYGFLGSTDGIGVSDKVAFGEILGGMLKDVLKQHGMSTQAMLGYAAFLRKKKQWVLTDFSERDLADVYFIEGLAYQYWYIAARLRSCGKGVLVRPTSSGDIDELRTSEQEELISSFDARGDRKRISEGFASNVGTYVRSDLNAEDAIVFANFNVSRYTAKQLEIADLHEDFAPNFLPLAFDADAFYESHRYLAPYFERKTGIGLLEFCQVAKAISDVLMAHAVKGMPHPHSIGLVLLLKFQRGYLFFGTSPGELKAAVAKEISKRRADGHLKQSKAEEQVEKILEFLTLDESKQPILGLWSHGPRFVVIKCGIHYFCDYSAWHTIFRNLFFGLRNYDPGSRKGAEFEYAFGTFASENSFDVVAQSKEISVHGLKREIDVAVRVNDDLYIFECRAFERPLDFEIGKPKTMSERRRDLEGKLDQATTLAEFIEANRVGDNYDFCWAKNIQSAVVSPYTEWVWSLDQQHWTSIPKFPRIMSAPEAIEYLKARRTTC